MEKLMNNAELMEYAIYHWVHGGNYGLPGLNQDGFFDHKFFREYSLKTDFKNLFDQFALIKNDPSLNDKESLMLCSGGVDSSLLACFKKDNLKATPQNFLHTSYVGHNNNDLHKFNNILNFCPGNSFVSSIDKHGYLSGLEFLSDNNFFQNTYAPTLAFSLKSINTNKFSCLVTGSGPDELFYGMEKYSWDVFEKLSEIPIAKALEKLDTSYNLETYTKLFNKEGEDLFQIVNQKRCAIYKNIAELGMPIYDSQRLLAFSTVTVQHMQLFNTVGQLFNLKHKAPYLNLELVKLALSTPLIQLVSSSIDKRVEMGKKHLKIFLSKYMTNDHIYGKKIGFHAPASKYVYEYGQSFIKKNIEFLPTWLNKDLTLKELKNRYGNQNNLLKDYFLYSLINVLKYNIKNISS